MNKKMNWKWMMNSTFLVGDKLKTISEWIDLVFIFIASSEFFASCNATKIWKLSNT